MVTEEMELYSLLDELIKRGKQKGRKPQEVLDDLSVDEMKKNQLRELLRFLGGEQEAPVGVWRY